MDMSAASWRLDSSLRELISRWAPANSANMARSIISGANMPPGTNTTRRQYCLQRSIRDDGDTRAGTRTWTCDSTALAPTHPRTSADGACSMRFDQFFAVDPAIYPILLFFQIPIPF